MYGIFVFSCILFSLSAPLMMSACMVILCLYVSILSFSLISDPWCSLIFLMIFFGGLLVLFVYISAIAHNEDLSINFYRVLFFSPFIFFSFSSYLSSMFFEEPSPMAHMLFSLENFNLSISLIIYLLIALLVVSQVSFFHFGALREKSVNTP